MSTVNGKYVCLDIDGVVLNLMQGIHLYLEPFGYNFDIDGIKAYNFKYDTLGFDRKIIFEALGNVKSFELAPFYDGAVDAVKKLSKDVGIPENLKDIVKPEDVDFLAQSAYDDACRPGNPRETSVEEIKQLYLSLM